MNAKSVQAIWARGTDAKPLKRLSARGLYTALKRGVNERSTGSHLFTFVRLCADMCGYVRIIGKKVWGPSAPWRDGTPSGGGRGCTKVTVVPEVTARFFRVEVPWRESTVHKIGFPKPAADGLARSLPLTRPSRASGFAQIPFAASQAAQVPLYQCAVAQSGPNVIFSGVREIWTIQAHILQVLPAVTSGPVWSGPVQPRQTQSNRKSELVRPSPSKSNQKDDIPGLPKCKLTMGEAVVSFFAPL
jgi:hypothetical protein